MTISSLTFSVLQQAMLKLMQGQPKMPVGHTIKTYKYQGTYSPCADVRGFEICAVGGSSVTSSFSGRTFWCRGEGR